MVKCIKAENSMVIYFIEFKESFLHKQLLI